ncbi:MAG: hypothetical protein HQL16_01385 [Candidatus Omnitrophica bacterium]|nr:hypothetical protein [Candidatus Omnitrophota bacterium]
MKKETQNEQELLVLIIKIQEQLQAQLTLLDKKLDTLINRPLVDVKPGVKPLPVPPVLTHVQGGAPQNNRFNGRVMHTAICADCKKDCSVPFKPTGDRPVYCQECFSRRKAGGRLTSTPSVDNRPKDIPQALGKTPVVINKPFAQKKKKVSLVKKALSKKKPVSKKKKK